MSSTKSSNGHLTPTQKKNKYSNSNKNHNDRNFSFNNDMIATLSTSSYNSNDLKINSLQEPTTPIDKINTPRTVTVPYITFFPPSPTNQVNDTDLSISGNSFF